MRTPNQRKSKNEIHRRYTRLLPAGSEGIGIRAKKDSSGFSGHTAMFGVVDSYGTAFAKGAFTRTFAERGDRIPALYQHNPSWVIGKHNELREDEDGVFVDISVIEDTIYGKEVMALLRADVPLGLSFGFNTIKSRRYEESDEDWLDFSHAPRWAQDPDNREYIYIIEEVRYWESSPVTFPANEIAAIDDVRSAVLADALSDLTEHIRTGTLTSEDRSLVDSLIAAYRETTKPEPEPRAVTTPAAPEPPAVTTPPEEPPVVRKTHPRYREALVLLGQHGIALEVQP